MALRVPKPRREAKKRRVKSEDISGRGTGERPYAWLHREPTLEETRARRQHRKLPPLDRTAAPQEFHKRRLAGGRPARERQKHVDLEKRLRRALDQNRERVELRPGDVRALVELYDRMDGKWRANPGVMFARAATRGVIDRVEALEGEMRRTVGREAQIARELREIVEQARETLGTSVDVEENKRVNEGEVTHG